MDPDQLEEWEFPLVRRGYDPELVRVVLTTAAMELRRLGASVHDAGRVPDLLDELDRSADELASLRRAHTAEVVEANATLEVLRSELRAATEARDLAEGRAAAAATEVAEARATIEELRAQVVVAEEERRRGEAEALLRAVAEVEERAAPVDDPWDRLAGEVASVLRAADDEAMRIRRQAEEAADALRAEAVAARAAADAEVAVAIADAEAELGARSAAAERDLAERRDEADALRRQADLERQSLLEVVELLHDRIRGARTALAASPGPVGASDRAVVDDLVATPTEPDIVLG